MKIKPDNILLACTIVATLFLVFGCSNDAESGDTVTHRLTRNTVAVEFWLLDGTHCVAQSGGGLACDWRTGDDFDGVPGR